MREYRSIIISVLIVLVALVAAHYFYQSERERQAAGERAATAPIDVDSTILEAKNAEAFSVKVYYYNAGAVGGDSRLLHSENRQVFRSDQPALVARQIISELFKGSTKGVRVFPETSRLRQLYVLPDGTAIVDLTRETVEGLAGGITTELVVIESITRSLIENVNHIKRVRFLIDGREEPTLRGHVSILRPFM